jgi:hypothetical protein
MRGSMDPEPLCCDFSIFAAWSVQWIFHSPTYAQHTESSDVFGMKVQVTQCHMYFSMNPALQRTFTAVDTWASMLQAGTDLACIMAVIISREWLKIQSCQNTSIFSALYLFCGRNQCKTQCQLPKQEIISDTMLVDKSQWNRLCWSS